MRSSNPFFLIALVTFCASLTSCATGPKSDAAPAAKRAPDTCVFFSALYDWQSLDDSTLVVWVPAKNDAYQVSLTMPLMGLKFAHTLGFVDGTRDGRLCSFGRDAITLGDGFGRNLRDELSVQRSTIRSIERLNAETLVQLEEKYKVKLVRESKRKAPPKTPDRATAQ